MSITQRLYKETDYTDGDKTWEPNHILRGVLEVDANSSSATVKTFPSHSDFINSNQINPGDAGEVIIWNKGTDDFQIAPGTGVLVGDPVVPAGGCRLVKFIISYGAIFCV